MEKLLQALKENKPRNVSVSADVADALKNPDCLSVHGVIFRNGGKTNGRDAIPFVELTPELLALLKALYA